MSWLPEERFPYSWWQSLLIKILRCGSLPSHVAFIMDGNRRFAKQNQLETIEGHIQGFEKLAQTLQWCHDLGINQVTVYAFRYAMINITLQQAFFHRFLPNSRQFKLKKLSSINKRPRRAPLLPNIYFMGNCIFLSYSMVRMVAKKPFCLPSIL